MEKVLCIACGEYEDYRIEYIEKNIEYRGKEIKYKEKVAYCQKCGEIVDVPGLWDENLHTIQKEYCSITDRCTVEDIDEVLEKYNIGKEALAIMLGWGRATIKRYYSGMLPSAVYSDEIKRILNSPAYFKERLIKAQETEKTRISTKAYKNALNRVNILIENSFDEALIQTYNYTQICYLLLSNNYLNVVTAA